MSNRHDVASYLLSCPGAELAALIGEVLAQRPENETEAGSETRLALAQLSREREDDDSWGAWKIALIARADIDCYGDSWEHDHGEPFVQFGECRQCGLTLASHAKSVLCPICGAKTGLT
jgi:rubrerythrin